jgi:glycosyltransferase involved in cell wall biosynthesis
VREGEALKNLRTLKMSNGIFAEESSPVLSVFSWVYNHKEFIQLSIDSILNQQTFFPVEIIIHDDASNDGTKDIIFKYQAQYPLLFNNILHLENQWSQGEGVMMPLVGKPRGKYIALTHGDDYWTDPLKLQKQVDFLEQNPEFSFCWHPVDILGDDFEFPEGPDILTFELMLKNHYIPTCSLVFRRECILDLPTWMNQVQSGDIALELFLATKGLGKKLNYKMAVYRRHSGGVSQTAYHQRKGRIERIKIYNYLLFSIPQTFRKSLKDSIYQIAKEELEIKNHCYTLKERFYLVLNLIKTMAFNLRILFEVCHLLIAKSWSMISFHLFALLARK